MHFQQNDTPIIDPSTQSTLYYFSYCHSRFLPYGSICIQALPPPLHPLLL